ncbi:hypothetical protein EAF04_004069 [Stromatinia cepivora]|nr:hypothetical protein EAF04_004069 [Stromatinia cepivora]
MTPHYVCIPPAQAKRAALTLWHRKYQGVPKRQILRNRNHRLDANRVRGSPSNKYRGTVTTDLGVPKRQILRNHNHRLDANRVRVSPSSKYRGTVTTDLGVPKRQILRNRNHRLDANRVRVSPSSKYRGTVTTDLCTKYIKTLEEILHENNVDNTAMVDVDVGDRSEDRNDRIEMKINEIPSRKIDINNKWLDSLQLEDVEVTVTNE